jgi:hypothetical protein
MLSGSANNVTYISEIAKFAIKMHSNPLKTGCELNNFFKLKFTLAWINYRYKFDLFW